MDCSLLYIIYTILSIETPSQTITNIFGVVKIIPNIIQKRLLGEMIRFVKEVVYSLLYY